LGQISSTKIQRKQGKDFYSGFLAFLQNVRKLQITSGQEMEKLILNIKLCYRQKNITSRNNEIRSQRYLAFKDKENICIRNNYLNIEEKNDSLLNSF
jgi:hypothetical protein